MTFSDFSDLVDDLISKVHYFAKIQYPSEEDREIIRLARLAVKQAYDKIIGTVKPNQ